MPRKKRMQGGGFLDVVKKANNVLKSTKAISTIANMAANSGLIKDPRALAAVGAVGGVAKRVGYGRRRAQRGGARIVPGMLM